METNRIIDSDSYKASHWVQYPPNSEATFSYLEARGSEREYTESVFFGLQYILKRYFSKPVTMEEVEEAKSIIEAHGEPFNYDGWKLLVERHGGKLPLKIRAVKEGTVVPTHNVLMTVETTDPDFYWLASYFETALMRVWYPITVATQSHYLRKLIYGFLEKTADDPDAEIAFKLHDFGSRGVSSQESAGLGGLAHLISFMGTDTMQALLVGRNYYHADMAGFSIPAGEHSTFSSWGRDGEVEAYRNMLGKFGHTGKLLAVVSDTWDIYNACENIWGGVLKQEVIDSGATVVIRPDSGDPVEVLCGVDPKNTIFTDGKIHRKVPHGYYGDEIGSVVTTQQFKGVLQILAEKFGYTINSKGYKVLNNVRVIQGDGVNPESIKQILTRMTELGFSTTNIAFGMGGALLQKVNRDTLKMAYKCSAIKINGKWVAVYKDPVTDKGKTSKKGRLDLIKTSYGYVTQAIEPFTSGYVNTAMVTYFENGEILVDDNFEAIRERLALTKS
jgi:nicotinamide phosphoribosyltransferase